MIAPERWLNQDSNELPPLTASERKLALKIARQFLSGRLCSEDALLLAQALLETETEVRARAIVATGRK